MELTFSTWRDEMHDALILQIADDQTPSSEKRTARAYISYTELVRAYLPGEVFKHHIERLVAMFNNLAGKKVKVVRTTDEMDKDRVPRIMLPYHIGLVYYDEDIA